MDVAKYILNKLKEKMDDVIIEESSNVSGQIKFVDNKIAKIGTEQLKNVGVFAVKNKRIVSTGFREVGEEGVQGFSSEDLAASEKLSQGKADELIKKILRFVKFVNPKEDYYGIANEKFSYKKVKDSYDKKVKDMDTVDYVEKSINSALKEGSKRVSGILENHEVHSRILTSNGVDVSEKGTQLYLSLRALFNENASGHMNAVSRVLNKFKVEDAGKKAGEIAVLAKNPKEGKDGKFDVVFDPLPMTALLSNVVDSLSVFYVESGLSFLKDKIGKEVAGKKVNLVDDALMENGFGSSSFDDEGRSTKKNVLVKDGVLKTYFHNTSTAKKYNVTPTGNAGLLDPSSFNFELVKGSKSREKLISGIDNGLLVTNVWYTRFNNYNTGEFSTIPRDGMFLIKNGKIKESLRNLRVSDNMLRILKNISEIGSNSEQISSWEAENNVKTPSVVVRDVNVTKAKD